MPPLPSVVRAALGLAVTVLDEARHLPDKAIELPMIAISRSLQLSMRAQQRYSALAARGDDLLAGNRTTDDAPPWATFDDEPGSAESPVAAESPVGAESPVAAASPVGARKTVRAPRAGSPSAFDTIGDPTTDDPEQGPEHESAE